MQTAQGLRWTVGANTTFQNIVDDVIQPDKPPLLIEDRNDELVAVSSGKADVAMFDLPAAEAIAHADPHFAVAAQLAETEPIAAALPEGSSNVDAVSSALRADAGRRDDRRPCPAVDRDLDQGRDQQRAAAADQRSSS